MAEPTTTSYAILCLLAVKPWTTYELAQQMVRSVGGVWPRAASVVYEEPKRLVDLGLATARSEFTGRRPRTVYAITPKGRRALARWLEEPGAGPILEFEALLKVAFADHGSVEGLRTNLVAIRDHARGQVEYSQERIREYEESGGPFPHRLPVIMLTARFFLEFSEMLERWSAWAQDQVADWDDIPVAVPDS